MAGSFYAVDLSRDERLARNPNYVDEFLVELCAEHGGAHTGDIDRQGSATEVAIKALDRAVESQRQPNGYVLADLFGGARLLGETHSSAATICHSNLQLAILNHLVLNSSRATHRCKA